MGRSSGRQSANSWSSVRYVREMLVLSAASIKRCLDAQQENVVASSHLSPVKRSKVRECHFVYLSHFAVLLRRQRTFVGPRQRRGVGASIRPVDPRYLLRRVGQCTVWWAVHSGKRNGAP